MFFFMLYSISNNIYIENKNDINKIWNTTYNYKSPKYSCYLTNLTTTN